MPPRDAAAADEPAPEEELEAAAAGLGAAGAFGAAGFAGLGFDAAGEEEEEEKRMGRQEADEIECRLRNEW